MDRATHFAAWLTIQNGKIVTGRAEEVYDIQTAVKRFNEEFPAPIEVIATLESDFDYIGLAQCTKSDQFHGELVTDREFMQTLGVCIAAINKLDAIKKALFYGRKFQLQEELDGALNCATLVNGWTEQTGEQMFRLIPTGTARDIIHSVLGAVTESGESLELLNKMLRDPQRKFDRVNFKEEMFDAQWYHAIGSDAINITFDEGQRNNIAKLRKRFGDKFTEYDANNRDLNGEREVLEVTVSRFSGDIVENKKGNTITREFVGKAHFDGHDISHDPV